MKETTMFKNVLVGVDGHANGRDAIALARQLTSPAGKITLAHVHRGELDLLNGAQRELLKEDREASSKLLEQEREASGVAAELRSVVALSAAAGLHRQAELQGADLLVVGSCRHGAVGRAMLGDDARDALAGAPCTVAIAAHGFADRQGGLATIGVAYDGSPESEAALRAARAVAAATGAGIQVRQVVFIPTMAYSGFLAVDLANSIEQMLNDADRRIEAIPGVTGKAVYGPTDAELEAFSVEVDILFVGSRGYGPVKRLMLGSTSNYLARHAGCSLIVLPRAASRHDRQADADADAEREPTVGVAG
jgi:nucleotide-binding universal stress UspA family protein